jgi:hypothetical protein
MWRQILPPGLRARTYYFSNARLLDSSSNEAIGDMSMRQAYCVRT